MKVDLCEAGEKDITSHIWKMGGGKGGGVYAHIWSYIRR